MKKTRIIAVLVILIVIITAVYWSLRRASAPAAPATHTSIAGCYVATNGEATSTLAILSAQGSAVSGTLTVTNKYKDSSRGTLTGSYSDGVLLGTYTFQSEGTTSTMDVAFKRSGDNFIRGYGTMDASGMHFSDPVTLTYDSSSVLATFVPAPCATTPITFPAGGEHLVAGHTYVLQWTPTAESTTQIFLIDTALEPIGASVSSVDRVYDVPNTGTYSYTLPKTMKAGTYKFMIGEATSNTFEIVSP
ncbi:MAG TPA: Ser-Thr-rich GPI-anchored membrane family protein [Candidatus Paceibacterota bacterium]|nr:Ser-Thr-rich GPI-anchored membrane family protein [Candidatus Paceibacterota bacterium]